jgi:hypothetical protein
VPMAAEPLYYHGGPPGLARIEPRSKTGALGGATSDQADLPTRDNWHAIFCPDYRVYLTTDYRSAALCAAAWATKTHSQAGCVYIVRPGADLDIDMAWPAAWSAESAEVIEVVGPVAASRLPELIAWCDRQQFTDRLATWDDWRSYLDRVKGRALRNGWDEATVDAIIAGATSDTSYGTRHETVLAGTSVNLTGKAGQPSGRLQDR